MNLASAFLSSCDANASKTALFWGEQELSYIYLRDQSRAVARQLLHEFNVQPGDRIGLCLKNQPEFITALFGIWLAGAVAVPINHFLKSYEVEFILDDAGIKTLICERESAEALLQNRPEVRPLMVDEFPSLISGNVQPPIADRADLAVIIYTSGTTGRPKGAMLSHGNLLHNVESCRQVLEAVSFDRFALLLPMFHSFMLCVCVLLPLLVGGSIVLVKSIHPAKNVVQEIIRREATLLPAVPQFFRAMASSAPPGKLPLRLCVSGAAPLPAEILREFTNRLSIPLLEGYGLSEASPVVSMNPLRGPWKAGSIGIPIPGVEVTIQDDTGKILPTGEVGELCVRGGNVMLGYWNLPEPTKQTLRDGWLLTGDLGYADSDGYLYITDRKKDMLLVNGINVYPREIEEVLYQLPNIKEAAVIGCPDARRGEHPLAFVAVTEGAAFDEHQALQFIRNKLADYKVPRHVVLLDALPRNATGKILKTALREIAAQKA